MPPLDLNQFLPCKESQPDERRDFRLLLVFVKPLCRFDVSLLNYIRRIYTTAHPAIHSQLHHSTQALAVLGEKIVELTVFSIPPLGG